MSFLKLQDDNNSFWAAFFIFGDQALTKFYSSFSSEIPELSGSFAASNLRS